MKCTSALLHCTSLINEPPIVDALLPINSAVEPESATEYNQYAIKHPVKDQSFVAIFFAILHSHLALDQESILQQ